MRLTRSWSSSSFLIRGEAEEPSGSASPSSRVRSVGYPQAVAASQLDTIGGGDDYLGDGVVEGFGILRGVVVAIELLRAVCTITREAGILGNGLAGSQETPPERPNGEYLQGSGAGWRARRSRGGPSVL